MSGAPISLTPSMVDGINAAIGKLEALRDGKLRDGQGGTSPDARQVLAHLRGAMATIDTVAYWVEGEVED